MSIIPTAAVVCCVLACGTVVSLAGESRTAILDVDVKVVRSCSVDTGSARRAGLLTVNCNSQTGAVPQISVRSTPRVTLEPTWTTVGGVPSDNGATRLHNDAPSPARTPSPWRRIFMTVDVGPATGAATISF